MKVRNKTSITREIAATGQIVVPGGDAEVDDTLAASLLEQVDVWEAAKPKPAEKPKPETSEENS